MNKLKTFVYFLRVLPKVLWFHVTKRKKAIYIGCTDMKNIGDESLFLAIKRLFPELYFFKCSYKHRSYSLSVLRRFAVEPDILLLGGGTLIARGPKEGYLKLFLQIQEIFPTSKLFVFGPGVTELSLADKLGIYTDVNAWKKTLEQCQGIAVRGNISKVFLKEWGLQKEVYASGDPVVAFAHDRLISKSKERKIALNFCDIRERIYGQDQDAVVQFANELIELLFRDKWQINLFPMTDSDNAFMFENFSKSVLKNVNIIRFSNNLQKTQKFLETMDLSLAQRLHAIIFSANTYTPFQAIEYHSKTADFLQLLDMPEYSMRTDQLDPVSAFNRLNYLFENLEKEQKLLFDRVQNYKTRLVKTSRKIEELF